MGGKSIGNGICGIIIGIVGFGLIAVIGIGGLSFFIGGLCFIGKEGNPMSIGFCIGGNIGALNSFLTITGFDIGFLLWPLVASS